MSTSLPIDKLEDLRGRFEDLGDMLCQQEIASDGKRFTKLSRERGELEPLVNAYDEFRKTQKQLDEDREALNDPELRELVQEEIPELEAALVELTKKLQLLLLPKDPNDDRDIMVEIRSGAGGEEAALFAADLVRMYTRFAERRGWKIELMSTSAASAGGFKEAVLAMRGDRVYSVMRFEGGVHRVQRVPVTESQGRIHTSTATVAVMAEADDVEVVIKDSDLRITATAAGGAGGQKVNTTNSAVQILHKPTNILIRCEQERSQHQNKDRAMQLLRAKLYEIKQQEQDDSISAERRNMVGSGDRAEKIRTYNYPQNRVTDHRVHLTLHSLDKVMEGEIDEITTTLRNHHQAAQLEAQSRSDS